MTREMWLASGMVTFAATTPSAMREFRSATLAPDHESDMPDSPKLVSTKIFRPVARS